MIHLEPAELVSRAVEHGVAVWEHGLGCYEIRGKDGLDLLHRLSTNDLLGALGSQTGSRVTRTVFTTEKGRVVADAEVVVTPGRVLLVTQATAMARLREWIGRFTILEEIELTDITSTHTIVWLIGPDTASISSIVQAVTGTPADAAREELVSSHGTAQAGTGTSSRKPGTATVEVDLKDSGSEDTPDLGGPADIHGGSKLLCWESALGPLPGIRCLGETGITSNVHRAVTGTGRTVLDASTFELLRILACAPIYPNELNENVHPLEAGLREAISFNKGCYVGQEVVARLDAYDKVRRELMLLSVHGIPVRAEEPLEVIQGDTVIGVITSTSEALPGGSCVALALCRKSSQVAPGTPLRVRSGTRELAARVATSPFLSQTGGERG